MGEFSIGEQVLFTERVSRDDAETRFVLRIEYERGASAGVDRVEFDAETRQEVTEDAVAERIEAWQSETVREFVRSFEVYERIDCRRGNPTEESRERWLDGSPGTAPMVEGATDEELAELEERVGFSTGDRVAYHVQGPNSSVYGHVAEARVEKAPPWTKGSASRERRIVDRAVLERGGDSKEIPLEWIIGRTDMESVAERVDRPYEDG